MTKEMIKELRAMAKCGMISKNRMYSCIEIVKVSSVEEFESMSVTEAVDYVLEMV